MKSSTKWALIFGSGAAILNFASGFITSLFSLIFSPIAAGLATYILLKEKPIKQVGVLVSK